MDIADLAVGHDVLLDAGPLGKLTMRAVTDPRTGALACHVNHSKISGTFTLEPAFTVGAFDEASSVVTVHYGGPLPPGAHYSRHRPDRPVIRRTTHLIGSSLIDAMRAWDGARTPRELGVSVIWRRDACSRYRPVPVPRRIAHQVAGVLSALALHWLERPDFEQLRRTAACRAIRRHRLLDRLLEDMNSRQDALNELGRRALRRHPDTGGTHPERARRQQRLRLPHGCEGELARPQKPARRKGRLVTPLSVSGQRRAQAPDRPRDPAPARRVTAGSGRRPPRAGPVTS